ncbi:hypothetical protein [Streptomyces flaveolus]|uniref:hypothetical protein n=1 Tax=Streptomyces flaveolus TaxID=67297 RepID=UPI0036F7D9D0
MASRLLATDLALAVALTGPAFGPLSLTEAAPAHDATVTASALAQLALRDAATVDVSGNSCPTRQDLLARDLDRVVRAEEGCTVLSCVLHDRYTDRTIDLKYGPRTPIAVQIDHIVPPALGWQPGARELTAEGRLNYANDGLLPRELLDEARLDQEELQQGLPHAREVPGRVGRQRNAACEELRER